MFSFKNLSILQKIYILYLSTLLIALIGVFFVVFTIFKTNIEDTQKKYLEHVSINISENIFSKISTLSDKLLKISQNKYIKSYNETFEEASLAKLLSNNKSTFSFLSYTDENGDVLYKIKNGHLMNGASNYKKDEFFQKILSSNNKVLISKIRYNSQLKKYTLDLGIQIKSYFGNKFLGILLASVPLERLIDNNHLDKNTHIRVIKSAEKHLIYSTHEDEINTKISLNSDIFEKQNDLIKTKINYQETITKYFPIYHC